MAPLKPPPTTFRPPLIDTKLLEALERTFRTHAGADQVIDVPELRAALGLRSELLAERVLRTLDKNGDGVISRDEFIVGVKNLIHGTVREKLEFAFRMHDLDGDGSINRGELYRMISITLGESELRTRESMPPERLGHALLSSADSNRDGRISFDEFETLMRTRPDLLDRMTRAEVTWISPGEDLLARIETREQRRSIRRVLENDWPKIVFFALCFIGIAGAFALELRSASRDHAPLLMGLGRASAASIKVCAALVLLPILRQLLTYVRATRLHRVVPVDDALLFHKVLGHTLFVLGGVHAVSMLATYARGHAHLAHAFASRTGGTGLALFLVFMVMWVFALGIVRRSRHFETFYFTHRLYVVWIVLAAVHAPSLGVVMGLSIVAFLVEQAVRARRRARPSKTTAAHALRSGVVRLDIERPKGFKHRAGDYLFLRIPSIARHEWHPFTISSAPEREGVLTVHARSLGNWTSALRRLVEIRERTEHAPPIALFVDGPYGSPSGHVFESRFAVFIAAGIGVTPFASILESLVIRERDELPPRLEKGHFFWLNRDQYSFEWFVDLLRELEAKDAACLLDVHLFMTGARTGGAGITLELARDLLHAETERDLVTGLRTKTHFGHPDWERVLTAIRDEHRGAPVDVFFCGPRGLGAKLRPLCEHLGLAFREEQF